MTIIRKLSIKFFKMVDVLFDHPHKNYPIIHVTGTDGKGSTSSMIASILMEAGYKTGTLNSPPINGDCIKLNGNKIPASIRDRILEKIKKTFDFFNIKYAKKCIHHIKIVMTTFLYFKEEKVDIAVVEVACGAETDCTNIISPIVSVVTNVTGDHWGTFKTITNYAREKAGIIKPNTPCFVGETPMNGEVKDILLNKAQECNAPITFTDEENNNLINEYKGLGEYETKYGNFISELGGDYQYTNINLVLNVIEELRRQGYNITDEHIVKGLENVVKNTKLYGRWQILHRNPTVILDACHTPDAWSKVMPQLKNMNYNKLHVIVAIYNNRDINKITGTFYDDENISYYFPITTIKRIRKPFELMKVTDWMQKSKRYESDYVKNTVDKLIKESDKNDIIFIGGNTEYVSIFK